MATVAPKGNCLVARAIPSESPADQLSNLLGKLTVNSDANQKSVNKFESQHGVTPSDFRDIQNIRSSALAKKTKTSKFQLDGVKLFADLTPNSKQNKKAGKQETNEKENEEDVEVKKEKDNEEQKVDDKEKKAEKEPEDGDKEEAENKKNGELLGRGPVQNIRVASVAPHHPYIIQKAQIPYGCVPQPPMADMADITAYTGYGSGYECGSTWSFSPDTTIGSISASTTPDTVLSSDGYGSSSPPQHSPKDSLQSPFSEISSADTSRVLTPENNELPESLQDFILQYSNQYSKEESPKGRPPSADSGVCSPMSARSAPNASPHVPQGTYSGPTTPSFNQTRLSPRTTENATAKQRLHAIIPESDLATGFHWACTTWSTTLLSNRDADGDTPLHIVAAHNDLGKIYGLCETMKKTIKENENSMYNVSNNFGETPLYVAVLQRSFEVVDYFLEIGASPNGISSRAGGDTPLHFAASRGMTNITEILLGKREVRVNATNDDGQTPLLCAVKMHGMMDEQTQQKIDNKNIMQALMKAGADPTIAESSTGKNIVHHAVDKMDVDLLDFLQTVVNEDTFTELANLSDFQGDTAVDLLCSSTQTEDTNNHVRECLYIRLLASGAIGNKSRA